MIVGCVWRFRTVSNWTYQHIPHETKLVTDELLSELDTGDVVFHSGQDHLSKLIKFFTGAHACHVGVIVRDPSRRVRCVRALVSKEITYILEHHEHRYAKRTV